MSQEEYSRWHQKAEGFSQQYNNYQQYGYTYTQTDHRFYEEFIKHCNRGRQNNSSEEKGYIITKLKFDLEDYKSKHRRAYNTLIKFWDKEICFEKFSLRLFFKSLRLRFKMWRFENHKEKNHILELR